jgi:hypothetical protein
MDCGQPKDIKKLKRKLYKHNTLEHQFVYKENRKNKKIQKLVEIEHNTSTEIEHNTSTEIEHNTSTEIEHNTSTEIEHNTVTSLRLLVIAFVYFLKYFGNFHVFCASRTI